MTSITRLAALAATPRAARPRVWFEEWNEPLIAGIGWVSELIGIAGGEDIFADRARSAAARDRIVTPDQLLARAPEVILASWCGKKVVPARIAARPGWADLPAIRADRLHEIKARLIPSLSANVELSIFLHQPHQSV